MLRFSSVSYRAGNETILDNLSFHLPRGSVCFATGTGSSGKTTLIRLASCQIHPSSGLIYTAGLPLFRYNGPSYGLRRKISVASPESILFEQFTVLENLRLQLSLSVANKETINAIIELFELKPILNKKIAFLSAYQKGRVIIASSLMKKPSIIFIDDVSYFFNYKNLQKLYHKIAYLSGQGLTALFTADKLPEFASESIEVHIR